MKGRQWGACMVSFVLIGAAIPVRAEEAAENSETVAAVEVSSAPVAAAQDGIGTAISDLNYKIELMQSRYLQLNGDIDNLRGTDSALRKMIAEDRLSIPDPKRLTSLEAEADLIRSDLAQVRQDMATARAELAKINVPVSKEEKLLRSPWIGISALGLSLIALIVR